MSNNSNDLKLSVGLIIFCLFCLFFLIPNQVGSLASEAALMPVIIIIFILFLSVMLMVKTLRQRRHSANHAQYSNEDDHHGGPSRLPIILAVIGIMIGYAWLLGVTGFILTSLLGMVILFLTFGVRDYKKITAITGATLGVLYFSFEKLLNAPLPVGTLIERFMD